MLILYDPLTSGDIINLMAVSVAFLGLLWSVLRAQAKEREIREEARVKHVEMQEEMRFEQQQAFEAIRTRLTALEVRDETTQKLITGEVNLDRRLAKVEAMQGVILDFLMRRARVESLERGFATAGSNNDDNEKG